ncbi:hypothetical protein CDAR_257401 [Caerostris darwini]|uniref:Uncharacterized protein n=1 Tax=Caerostris darwini TaxID=1538125 RepID=A0AAV4TAD1_9ARAC|nr:hypothetical protein CDAR_257401 [Caerostris darwini]
MDDKKKNINHVRYTSLCLIFILTALVKLVIIGSIAQLTAKSPMIPPKLIRMRGQCPSLEGRQDKEDSESFITLALNSPGIHTTSGMLFDRRKRFVFL